MYTEFWMENLKGRGNLEGLGVDGPERYCIMRESVDQIDLVQDRDNADLL